VFVSKDTNTLLPLCINNRVVHSPNFFGRETKGLCLYHRLCC